MHRSLKKGEKKVFGEMFVWSTRLLQGGTFVSERLKSGILSGDQLMFLFDKNPSLYTLLEVCARVIFTETLEYLGGPTHATLTPPRSDSKGRQCWVSKLFRKNPETSGG